MKGRAYKISVPSSNHKELRIASPYPKTFQRKPAMDLSYPIFKLESRAEWERECAEMGVEGDDGQPMTPDRQAELKAGCLARALACEQAARILKATPPSEEKR